MTVALQLPGTTGTHQKACCLASTDAAQLACQHRACHYASYSQKAHNSCWFLPSHSRRKSAEHRVCQHACHLTHTHTHTLRTKMRIWGASCHGQCLLLQCCLLAAAWLPAALAHGHAQQVLLKVVREACGNEGDVHLTSIPGRRTQQAGVQQHVVGSKASSSCQSIATWLATTRQYSVWSLNSTCQRSCRPPHPPSQNLVEQLKYIDQCSKACCMGAASLQGTALTSHPPLYQRYTELSCLPAR